MSLQTREVRPHAHPRKVVTKEGEVLDVPKSWILLEPGDATLTRRVKAAGPTWTMKRKKGRRDFSLGVWTDRETVEIERLKLLVERATPDYQQRLRTGRERRAKQEEAYGSEFRQAILAYLDFHPRHVPLAEQLAARIADHAVPVGSGTVARTRLLPLERRAEAATLAWMRHQTTGYDSMVIARAKGERREVRRRLAAKSKALLAVYRRGEEVDATKCPLQKALR